MLKLCSFTGLVLLIASVVWTDIDAYWTGWMSPTWPAYGTVMAPVFGVSGALLLFAAWIVSMRRKTDRVWTTIMGLMVIPVIAALIIIVGTPQQLTVQGFRNHLFKVTTQDDLVGFARQVQKDSSEETKNREGAGILTPQQIEKYAIQPRYSFLTWGHYRPLVSVESGDVLVLWGGGFGHWGFSVDTRNGSVDVTAD